MTSSEKMSVDQAMTVGWNGMLKYFVAFMGITSVTCIVTLFPILLTLYFTYVNSGVPFLLPIVGIAAAAMNDMVSLGLTKTQMMCLDEKSITTKDVFSVTWEELWSYMRASFCFKAMTIVGYCLFIIPGVLWQIEFQFYPYFILEKGMGPIEALKASHALTQGIKMELFLFGIVQWFVGQVGMMVFLIGSFPAWIINKLAVAQVYRQLTRGVPEDKPAAAAEPGAIDAPTVPAEPAAIDAPTVPAEPAPAPPVVSSGDSAGLSLADKILQEEHYPLPDSLAQSILAEPALKPATPDGTPDNSSTSDVKFKDSHPDPQPRKNDN